MIDIVNLLEAIAAFSYDVLPSFINHSCQEKFRYQVYEARSAYANRWIVA